MTNSKIILFSSSSLYLSYPQFKAIISELSDFKKLLLNVNEPDVGKIDDNYIKEKNASKIFDIYIKTREIKQFQFSRFQLYLKYKKLLTKYLYKINPDAIITCSDLSISARVMFSWCKKNRVPYIILQPSFIEGIPEKYGLVKIAKFIVINKILGIPVYRRQNLYGHESQKSYLFLWGKHFIKNPKRKNLFILGNSAFDNLFKNFIAERIKKNTILICTENLDFFGKEIFDQVNNIYLEAIKSKPEINFYIKVHPREPIEKYEKIFPKSKFPNVKVVKNQDLYELFKLSDIQITVASFTSFEAAAMGLPIIIIRPENTIKLLDHFREEIDIRVNKVGDIVKAINLALSDEYWIKFLEKREKYFKKMLYSTDALSSKRVASIIRKLILKKT